MKKRQFLSIAGAAFAAALPCIPSALAVATYTASGTVDLTITGFGTAGSKPAGVTITGDAFVGVDDSSTTGGGTASTSTDTSIDAADPFDLDFGEGIHQAFTISGSASALGDSSTGFASLTGIIDISNTSLEDVVIDLLLEFDLAANASGNPATEVAFASSILDVYEEDLSTGVSVIHFELVEADAALGIPAAGAMDSIPFSVTVVSNSQTHLVVSLLDGVGTAEVFDVSAPVPDSGTTFMLLLPGLLGLFACRVRRRS